MATGSSTLVEVDSDGGLVLATLAGDRAAFAALYARFAARVYDLHLTLLPDARQAVLATHHTFRVAVADLNHLGEPAALRPWLYAHAYRQARRFRESPPGQHPHWAAALPAEPDPAARLWQLMSVAPPVKDAALVTLHLRHGLPASELGRIVGLSTKQARTRLDRLGADLEPTLRILLAGRPAVGGHIPGAGAVTGRTGDEGPPPLRTVFPFAVPPDRLREEVLRGTPLASAHQGLPRPRTPGAWVAASITALVLVAGSVLFVHRTTERRPVIAVRFGPASEFGLSTTVIDLGDTASSATVTLSNTGSNVLAWRADPATAWLKVTPPSGTLSGGRSQLLTVTADRSALPEGDGRTELQLRSSNGQGEADVSVALREERPPAIIRPRASNTRIGGYGCSTTTEIRATITDESQPVHVVLVGPGAQTQVMQGVGDTYTGKLGSGSHADIVWRIIATDTRNNTATSPTQTVRYADCAARPVTPKPPPARPTLPARPVPSPPSQPEPGDGASTGQTSDDGADGTGSSDDAPTGEGTGAAGTADGGTGAGDTSGTDSSDADADTN